jgi:hypothetical protein
MVTNVIVNKSTGEQLLYEIGEGGSYTLGSDTLVWDEDIDGNAINELGDPWTDAQLRANVGRFTRETSPSLHLLSGGYITGHLAAIEDRYERVIEVWQLKFELNAIAQLTAIDAAVTATYATVPLNEIRWEQKKFVISKGHIWDIIQDEFSYTNTQMIEFWDECGLWDADEGV